MVCLGLRSSWSRKSGIGSKGLRAPSSVMWRSTSTCRLSAVRCRPSRIPKQLDAKVRELRFDLGRRAMRIAYWIAPPARGAWVEPARACCVDGHEPAGDCSVRSGWHDANVAHPGANGGCLRLNLDCGDQAEGRGLISAGKVGGVDVPRVAIREGIWRRFEPALKSSYVQTSPTRPRTEPRHGLAHHAGSRSAARLSEVVAFGSYVEVRRRGGALSSMRSIAIRVRSGV